MRPRNCLSSSFCNPELKALVAPYSIFPGSCPPENHSCLRPGSGCSSQSVPFHLFGRDALPRGFICRTGKDILNFYTGVVNLVEIVRVIRTPANAQPAREHGASPSRRGYGSAPGRRGTIGNAGSWPEPRLITGFGGAVPRAEGDGRGNEFRRCSARGEMPNPEGVPVLRFFELLNQVTGQNGNPFPSCPPARPS
jgi:hypothetical protein